MGQKFPNIDQLIQELEELIKENPGLAPLQKKLDRLLETVGDDPEKRMALLSGLLMDHFKDNFMPRLLELKVKMNTLQNILDKKVG